jgi:hypothetical protein
MITLNEFKTDYLNVATSETTYDTILQRFIDTAVEQLEAYCGQSLLTTSKTFEYRRYSQLLDIAEVYRVPFTPTLVQDRESFSDSYVANTAYAVETDGRNYRLYFTTLPARYVKVTATVGYTTSNAPAPLKEATGRLALELVRSSIVPTMNGENTFGIESISTSTPVGTTTIKLVPLSKEVRAYVNDWRVS